MNQTFTFTITKDEYLQYLRQQIGSMKSYQGYKFWIRTSIPAFLVVSSLFFRLYHYLWWNIAAIVVALFWIFLGTTKIWKVFLQHRIQERTLDAMNIKGFQEVTIDFLPDKITYKDIHIHDIAYDEIKACVPIKSVFVFQYQEHNVLLLPYRVFSSEEDMKNFLYHFDKRWMQNKEEEAI